MAWAAWGKACLGASLVVTALVACQRQAPLAPATEGPAPGPGSPVAAALGLGEAAGSRPAIAPTGAVGSAAPFAEPTRMAVGPEAVAALVNRANLGAMDGAFGAIFRQHPPKRQPAYQLQAPSLSWTQALGGACSNTLGISKPDTGRPGPGPYADEWIYALRDDGTLTKRNPITGAVLGTVALGGTYTRTAVQVSGDNRRLYVADAAGTLKVLRVSDLATVYSGQISRSGFVGSAPFIDYANGGGFPLGTEEHVTLAANDGSIVRALVQCPPKNVNPNVNVTVSAVCYAASGSDNATMAMLPAWTHRHVVAHTGPQNVQTGCVAWAGDVWFGTQAGTVHRLATSLSNFAAAPSLASWDIAPYSNATGNGLAVGAPGSVDFDANNRINAYFVGVADRAVWIDPSSATPRVSPSLILDKIPPVAQRQGWLSNFPYTNTLSTYTALDWICIAKDSAPTPTRWGAGTAVAASTSVGTQCWTLKTNPNSKRIWAGRSTSPGNIRDLNVAGTAVGSYNTTANNVWQIDFAPNGDSYCSHGGSRVVTRLNANGTLKTPASITIPAGTQAYWASPNSLGQVWISSQSGNIYKYGPAADPIATVPLAGVYCLEVDAANNLYAVRNVNAANNVVKYNNAGTIQWQASVGNAPNYCVINPAGTELWVSVGGGAAVARLNANTGAVIGTYTVPTQPFGLNFDNDGNPWVCCSGNDSVNKLSGSTGAILASYTVPGSGNMYEVDFDANGDAWVCADNGTYKISDLGNLADLFATEDRQGVGDGNDAYAFVRFRVTNNSYGGGPPISAQVRFTAATTPISAPAGQENLSLWKASPFHPSTSAIWTGYAGTPDVDWNSRPTLFGLLGGLTNQAVAKDAAVDLPAGFGADLPLDKANSSDAAGGVVAYGLRTEDKVLRQAAHWYSNTTAPGAAQRPTLRVQRNGTPLNTNFGLRCQPGVGSGNRVYFASSNAVFELNYGSLAAFQDPAQIAYNLTAAGVLNAGPVFGGAHFHNRTSVSLSGLGKLIVVDQDSTSNRAYLNRLSLPFHTNPTASHLEASQDLNPAQGVACPQLLWDYANGSAYLTTGSNHAVRATIWQ